MTEKDPVSKAIVVVMRVADLPKPWVPSSKTTCSECGEETWIGPAAYKRIAEPVPVCFHCMGLSWKELLEHGEML